ncbi:hypothetical protein HOH87_06925 [bacterium]|nr:hypothetical protein [bacterium]
MVSAQIGKLTTVFTPRIVSAVSQKSSGVGQAIGSLRPVSGCVPPMSGYIDPVFFASSKRGAVTTNQFAVGSNRAFGLVRGSTDLEQYIDTHHSNDTHYRTLGVLPGVTSLGLDAVYSIKMDFAKSESEISQLKDAYFVLSQPEKKLEYDEGIVDRLTQRFEKIALYKSFDDFHQSLKDHSFDAPHHVIGVLPDAPISDIGLVFKLKVDLPSLTADHKSLLEMSHKILTDASFREVYQGWEALADFHESLDGDEIGSEVSREKYDVFIESRK